jgi:hypothetical protein
LAELKAEDWTLRVEVPSCRSTPEGNHWAVHHVII